MNWAYLLRRQRKWFETKKAETPFRPKYNYYSYIFSLPALFICTNSVGVNP